MIKNPPSAKPRSRSTGNYDIPDRPLGRTPLTSAKSLLCVARQRTKDDSSDDDKSLFGDDTDEDAAKSSNQNNPALKRKKEK